MKKVLYSLPAVVICGVYLLLMAVAGGIAGFQPIVLAYIGLPVLGSAFLLKGKWWGGLIGISMGLLLIWNNLHDCGHQHVNVDLPLGMAFVVYYALMMLLCIRKDRR